MLTLTLSCCQVRSRAQRINTMINRETTTMHLNNKHFKRIWQKLFHWTVAAHTESDILIYTQGETYLVWKHATHNSSKYPIHDTVHEPAVYTKIHWRLYTSVTLSSEIQHVLQIVCRRLADKCRPKRILWKFVLTFFYLLKKKWCIFSLVKQLVIYSSDCLRYKFETGI